MGTNSILNQYGEYFIDALVSTGFDITVRPHPQSYIAEKELLERLLKKYPEGESFHWNRDADSFNVLNSSDIMISDFSGVIYDFTFIFERPVIYSGAAPDISVQDEAWLDEPYWGTEVLPRLGVELKKEDISSIKGIIENLIHSEKFTESIRSVRNEYWQNRGQAAEKVVDYIIKKSQSLRIGEDDDAGNYSCGGNGKKAEGSDAK